MRKLSWIAGLALLLGGLVWWLARSNQPAQAAVYWAGTDPTVPLELGVLSLDPDISVCFVGDALAKREDRVRQIVDYIKEFEYAANIRFVTLAGVPLQTALDSNPADLSCPSPAVLPDGSEYYHGDIRVVIPDTELTPGSGLNWTSPIPGIGCEQMSGSLNSDPEVVSWGSDHMHLVWRGGWDNTLRQKTFKLENGKWKWGNSTRIDGNVASGAALATLGVNDLHLFVRGHDGALWYQRGDGTTWNGWQSLGGSLYDDPTSNPDAISISANRLDVFVRWQDNTIRTITSFDGGSTWDPWVNLGGSATSEPTVASWGGSRMDVFVRGQNYQLSHINWNGTIWGVWGDLGGTLSSAPDAASWGANRIDVFAKAGDNTLIHRAWNGSGWTSWQNLGGFLTSGPTVVSRGLNMLDLFVRGGNGGTYRRTMEDGTNWSGWGEVGDNGGGGSWGNEPWFLDDYRACMFNLKLGDNADDKGVPWLNHTLHEFGHSLGLAHEHQRFDVDALCREEEPDLGGSISTGLLTPYDRDSVMHYAFPSCGIAGNYGHSGFSEWDKLALHIMYPEDDQVAEFVGTTVIPDSEQLSLQSAWLARGAYIDVAASNFQWYINGQYYFEPTLNIDLPAGEYTLEFSYQDFLGREFSYTGKVRVLDVDAYISEIVAPIMAELPLLYPNHLFTPTVDLSLQPDQNVSFFFPGSLFDQRIIIDYAIETHPPYPASMQSIGMFYTLEAINLADSQPAQILPGQTYQVTIQYEEAALSPYIREADLALYYWDGQTWQREESSLVDRINNLITASPGHFSSWAVLAPNYVFMPLMVR